jgi:hypothetical protein
MLSLQPHMWNLVERQEDHMHTIAVGQLQPLLALGVGRCLAKVDYLEAELASLLGFSFPSFRSMSTGACIRYLQRSTFKKQEESFK